MATEAEYNQSPLKRYRGIGLSILLLLLVTASVLGFNYYTSFRITADGNLASLASRQGVLVEKLAKYVYNIDALASAGDDAILSQDILATTDELRHARNLFAQTLDAFLNGGEVPDIEGSAVIKVAALSADNGRKEAENAQEIWLPYQRLIDSYIDSVDRGELNAGVIGFSSSYTRIFNHRLAHEMNDLNTILVNRLNSDTQQVRWVQAIGIAVALLLFLYIIFGALRQLLRVDRELAVARRETVEIMDTIQEGLFLIDDDLRIGVQQSKELHKILPVSHIAGRALDSVVSKLVSEADLVNTRRFIKQLFNKRVKANLLDDLNPLLQVKIMVNKQNHAPEIRYLRFKFNRVYENKQIVRVLVTVSNITHAVRLQQQLDQERRQNQVQTEMLVKVLQLDQELLAGFVRRTTQITQKVNQLLKASGSSQSQLRRKLDNIFREVHGFKGEASALAFDRFVDIAEEAEEKLKQLRNKSKLSGDDFIGVTVILDRLIGLNEDIAKIQNKLIGFSSNKAVPKTAAGEVALTYNMRNFAAQIAERQNKEIELVQEGFEDVPAMSQDNADRLHDILVQLLRNAIVHGIETPAVRIARDKKEQGSVTLSFKMNDGRAELAVEDDGGGIDLAALRERLRQDPRYQNQDVDKMADKQLYRVLFLPGFTTAAENSEDAGRGEGMSIIYDRIKQLPDGKIAIHSVPGCSTRFSISFKPE